MCMTFLRQDFQNGDLHFTYAMQISEHLARIVRMRDPSFEYGALGNPFVVRRLSNHLWHALVFILLQRRLVYMQLNTVSTKYWKVSSNIADTAH